MARKNKGTVSLPWACGALGQPWALAQPGCRLQLSEAFARLQAGVLSEGIAFVCTDKGGTGQRQVGGTNRLKGGLVCEWAWLCDGSPQVRGYSSSWGPLPWASPCLPDPTPSTAVKTGLNSHSCLLGSCGNSAYTFFLLRLSFLTYSMWTVRVKES